MKERVREDVKTGLPLDRVDSLLLPWVSDRWGTLRPPVSQEALRMSCALATATYNMDVKPGLEAGWQDVTIQVDGDLTTGIDLPDEDAGTMDRLAASWRMHRVRSRIKQRNPLGQVLDAFRQIRESDTGKALVMAHPAPDGRMWWRSASWGRAKGSTTGSPTSASRRSRACTRVSCSWRASLRRTRATSPSLKRPECWGLKNLRSAR